MTGVTAESLNTEIDVAYKVVASDLSSKPEIQKQAFELLGRIKGEVATRAVPVQDLSRLLDELLAVLQLSRTGRQV